MGITEAIRRLLDETSHREQRAEGLLDTDPRRALDNLRSASALIDVAVGLLEDD